MSAPDLSARPERGRRYRMSLDVTVVDSGITAGGIPWAHVNNHEAFRDGSQTVDWTNAEFEPISDPEPDWQPGDVVRDAEGIIWLRFADGGWIDSGGTITSDNHIFRPLTPLVLDRKPVTS